MRARRHLRRRIRAGLVLFGLTLVVFSLGTFVKAYYDGQDSLQESILLGEVARIQQDFANAGPLRLPRDGPVYAYRSLDDMSELHRNLSAGLGPGLHEIDRETGPAAARDLAIWAGTLGATEDPLWVLFDIPDVETIAGIAREYSELALAYGAALLLFGGWLASTISRRISKPLEHFATEIEAQAPGQWRGDFSHRYGDGEVGALAGALDTTIRRNREFLERERVFMQNASHELRTPLTVIGGAAEILETLADRNGPRGQRLVERIGRAAANMKSLTEAFLWLGRESDPESEDMSCDADAVVKEALRRTLPVLDGKPVEVGIHQDNALRVPCRPELLEIAVANLLRNAFQNINEGRVDVVFHDDAIEILDTGPGLPATEAADLRQRGRRGAGSEGFGLGLAIVGQVCARMGWQLTLENRGSGGCRALLGKLAGSAREPKVFSSKTTRPGPCVSPESRPGA